MKTKTQVLKEWAEYRTLINAVISRLGMDSVEDVQNHGVGGGFSGFIYYNDTVRFFNRHKKQIMKLADNLANECGVGVLELIQGFNCLRDFKLTVDEIAKAIYTGKGEMTAQIKNAMAWFAAEEVCRFFDN